jgi:hypothetical protein
MDEFTVCPTCEHVPDGFAHLPRPDGIAKTPIEETSSQEDSGEHQATEEDSGEHRAWWIRIPEIPDLLSPLSWRAVEVSFVLGTVAMFLSGVYGLFTTEWVGGVIFMVCSPLGGLMLAFVFSGVAGVWQLYWYAVGGAPGPPRRQLPQTPRTPRVPAGTRTDITTRSPNITPGPATPSPHVTPDSATPARSSAPVELPCADDPPPEEKQVPRGLNKLRIFWIAFLIGSAGSALLAWDIFDIRKPDLLCGGLCFGVPGGFLLGTLVMLLLRKKPSA